MVSNSPSAIALARAVSVRVRFDCRVGASTEGAAVSDCGGVVGAGASGTIRASTAQPALLIYGNRISSSIVTSRD
jgi:hypothetical protein